MNLTLNIPDSARISEADASIMLAMKLFETKKLSLGKAAAVAGLSYRAFYDLLRRYDVPVVTMTEDDVRREVEYARNHL
jgi:predicted HTH domain antitoxin